MEKEQLEKQTMMKDAVNYLTSIDFDHIKFISVETTETEQDTRFIVDVTIDK